MSDLAIPENRPALAWIMDIPTDWVTPTERLLLLALALDSYDGNTCAPGRDGIMRLAGIKYVSSFTRARDALTQPTEYRPALLAVDALKGRHTRYQLLRDVRESRTGDVRESQTGQPEMSARDVRESRTGSQDAEMSAEVVRESCPPEMSAEVVRESRTYPPSLPTPREEGREGEALTAPAPEGAARPRLTVGEIRDMVTAVVPATAIGTGIKCDNDDLADALATATANGWDTGRLRAALADMPAPKSSPTGLLIKRLQALADSDPAAVVLASTDAYAEATEHQEPQRTAPTVNPADQVNQNRLAKACKAHGVKVTLFADLCADLAGRGFTVEPLAHDDDSDQDLLLLVKHPDVPAWQCEWPLTAHRSMNLLAVLDPDLEATEADRDHLARHWHTELDDGWIFVNPSTVDLATFRQLVERTHQLAERLARAACERQPQAASQLPKAKAAPTATYTPPPVSEVLGAEPPDQYRPGMSAPQPGHDRGYRPPGHDQAVRAKDNAERLRQAQALAQNDPAVAEALAALQRGALITDDQEDTAS